MGKIMNTLQMPWDNMFDYRYYYLCAVKKITYTVKIIKNTKEEK